MFKPLLIAVLALAVVAAAVFVGGKYLSKETADETADWQTYRNEEYGFEFKYPPNWNITEGSFPSVSFTPRTNLNVFENPQRLPLAEWIEKERGDLVSQMRLVNINGMSALRGKESGLLGYDAVYFGKGTLIVSILSQENSQDTAMFETMLSTFKFTK